MRQDPPRKPAGKRRSAPAKDLDPAEQKDFDTLRTLRLEIAREEGVPPYVIFHDATLQALLADRPDSLEAMAGVQGIGRHKLEKYGQAFLDRLRSLD